MIEFSLSDRQKSLQEMIRGFAASVVRPQALSWDRNHGIPDDFLLRFVQMASSMGGSSGAWGVQGMGGAYEKPAKDGEKKKRDVIVTTAILSEELAWGDPALLLCFPGPGLGGPP